jgi:citrate synthase
MVDQAWLSAAEAARRLGIKRETLYAYVSRGLIRSTHRGGATRARRYAREDVERARRRAEDRRDPASIAVHALSLGSPVLESAITLIDHGRLYYRGHDVVELSRTRPVAEVASLIWTGQFDEWPKRTWPPLTMSAAISKLAFLPRAEILLAGAAAHDGRAFSLSAESVAATGARIMDLMALAASGVRSSNDATVESRLVAGWRLSKRAADLLRGAVILCADHELNVSAFTARCVASAGGTPYGAVIAGLTALEGIRHGGLSARVESMLHALRRERSVSTALGARLREVGSLDGFGHPLYPNGDPRATEILAQLTERYPRSAELRFALDFADAALTTLDVHPSVDFALAVLSRVLKLPSGSAISLFAMGRTIGWIGHAIEQYGTGELIRPRAKYTGPAAAARTERRVASRK